jgi:hypothetical protein
MQDQTSNERNRIGLYAERITLAVLFGVCSGLTYWTLRLADANIFLSQTPASIVHAATLDPWNANYRADLAKRSDGETSARAWREATRLDPLNSSYWIQRGIQAEFGGDPKSAERFYLKASQVSRLFGPRIALANYYFRQDDEEQFWKWVKAAFEISYGDLSGTFALCWQVTPDAKVILDRALPKDPGILSQFLEFALANGGVDTARPVADALLKCANTASRDSLLDYCERLLAAKRFQAAHQIWLGMMDRNLLATAKPNDLLYNAEFDLLPLQRGFDWKVILNTEVVVAPGGARGEINVTFSGNQPEECEVLSQVVMLKNLASYDFSFAYRSTSQSDTGLNWQIEELEPRVELAQLALPESSDWSPQAMALKGLQTPWARLVLKYQRRLGTVRYEGRVVIRQLRFYEVR